MPFNMDDYVPVNERIEAFYKEHPFGSIQSEIVELTEARVTVKAYAYRAPDDSHPGTGHSSLEIPGKTTFTRGSEIENAETSAWGRAIAALGFEVKRGVASAEEVRNKQPQNGERTPDVRRSGARSATTRSAVQSPREAIAAYASEHGLGLDAIERAADAVGVKKGERATDDQLRLILAHLETPDGVPTVAAGGGDGSSDLPAAPTDEELLAVTGGELIQPSSEAAVVPDSGASPLASEPPPTTVEDAIARAEARGKSKVRA